MKYFTKTAIERMEINKSDPPERQEQVSMRNYIADKPRKKMGLLNYLKFKKGIQNHRIVHG